MTSFGDERPSSLVAASARGARPRAAPRRPGCRRGNGRPAEYEAELNARAAAAIREEELEAIRERRASKAMPKATRPARRPASRRLDDGPGRHRGCSELTHLEAIGANFAERRRQADEAIASDVLELALHLARTWCAPPFRCAPN
jgi:flagellar assembly protein FliH